MLKLSNYNEDDTQFLVDDFKKGFDIGYRGPVDRKDFADNIPFSVGDKFQLYEKMMKEVKLGRFVGPFKKEDIPYKNFVQSPVGLVPKERGQQTRLIFHLSYDFKNGNRSINHWTPDKLCSVKYNDIDHSIDICLKFRGKTIFHSKTDLKSAFHWLPV